MNIINSFSGEYRFLSNFYICDVNYGGLDYQSSEHAYQAAKTLNTDLRRIIQAAPTPGRAKRLAKTFQLRPDWSQVKLTIMEDVLNAKFSQNPKLKVKLLATGDAQLIEGNHWDDTFWGVCKGVGENNLGKLLMKIRTELKELV